MNAKGGSLTFPSNPLAAMRELSELDNPPPTAAEPLTEENTEKNTYTHTEKKPPSHTASHTSRSKSSRTEGKTNPKTEAKEDAKTSALTSVRQRLLDDLQREPVARKTIDIPASLNERLQNYCAAKRIKTERRVFLVLLENFLEEEGF